MKLMIECNGEVFLVTSNLEDYDLAKPMAQSALCDSIRHEVKRIKKYEMNTTYYGKAATPIGEV